MPPWRQQAEEIFPELISRFAEAEVTTPYLLWFELVFAFGDAYKQSPQNESLIKRVYQYSDWCVDQPRGETAADDLLTCVAVCFYEHIPTIPAARDDMPRWWKLRDVLEAAEMFGYLLTSEQLTELKEFMSRERHRFDPSLRPAISLRPPT